MHLRQTGKKAFAFALAFATALATANLSALPSLTARAEGVEHTFVASALSPFEAGSRSDGDFEVAGDDGFFTLIYSAKSKVDSSSKTFEDGYESSQRVNFQGGVSKENGLINSLRFSTTGPSTVKVWWVAGGDGRQMKVLDNAGSEVAKTKDEVVKNSLYISELQLSQAGTYFLGGDGGNNYLFKATVTVSGDGAIARKEWTDVQNPSIKSVALNPDDPGKIDVTVSSDIGNDGGDYVTVVMEDAEGNRCGSKTAFGPSSEQKFSFTPSASGEYSFVPFLYRLSYSLENSLQGKNSEGIDFSLPLGKPSIRSAYNSGGGDVSVLVTAVPEAERYEIYSEPASEVIDIEVSDPKAVNEVAGTFQGLDIGTTYNFFVKAFKGEDETVSEPFELLVEDAYTVPEGYASFGNNASSDPKKDGYTKNEDGTITVWSVGNNGKLQNSTDGIAFYYYAVPADKNFTLTADVHVDEWTYTNGQEGFGLMAVDRVGNDGQNESFWNNSYMAGVTKAEYRYNPEKGVTKDANDPKITMKLGVTAREKKGVTPENLAQLDANDADVTKAITANTDNSAIEYSCGPLGAGTYNLVANALNEGGVEGTVATPLDTFHLSIRKNNTGYFVSYTDMAGNEIVKKYYEATDNLEQLDPTTVYAGLFAARAAKATFKNIELTLIDPIMDDPAEERPKDYVTPVFEPSSYAYSNTEKYELTFKSNITGTMNIKRKDGTPVATNMKVDENDKISIIQFLEEGENTFVYSIIPDSDFHPGNDKNAYLESYDEIAGEFTVSWLPVSGDIIYVSPDGSSDGAGTKEAPLDIFTAVTRPAPGQTIILESGFYDLSEGAMLYDKTGEKTPVNTVFVYPNIDGTAEAPITMKTEDGQRAVFDFGYSNTGANTGFEFAGDWWVVEDIDVNSTADGAKGLHVSGSHNVFNCIRTYNNGKTGFSISRLNSSQSKENWPAYNLVKNCTSWNNADSGREDADGFEAKLNVGEGNVFDGCIAYNNADDGWDLFAKPDDGPIGAVTIQNSVAFRNGYYLSGEEGSGNGNGFKLGGSNITGRHKLINCAAWGNKANGITCNSGPDIEIYECTSLNNKGANVALYTNAKNPSTDFLVNGLISFMDSASGTKDNLKPEGDQDENKIYSEKNFYFDKKSKNSSGLTVTKDWFVSLKMPLTEEYNSADPYDVARSLRSESNYIDLKDFLLLSDKGKEALEKAGLNEEEIGAHLSDNYTAFANGVGVNRLYNPNSGEHFFTPSLGEAKYLAYVGWNAEGFEWKAPNSGLPVYRVYNPNAGDHHYTNDRAEVENLIEAGWNDEGVAFYYDPKGNTPVYRAYNPNAISGAHHFTADKEEYDHLISIGWRAEGVAFTVE